jgi:C4-dicarboxylate-specific signal transduction histidine kinase
VLAGDGAFLGIRAGNRDVTGRREAELEMQRLRYELAHVARVTTLGQLAASLAHELNQPLGAILCNAEAAQSLLDSSPGNLDEVRAALGDIVEDDQRAGQVIRRLRAMFRKDAIERQSLIVNDLVRETLALLRSELVIKNISLQLDLAPELPLVAGGRVELQQVLMNLVLNAADAMANRESGRRILRIQTSIDGPRYVRVSVSGLPVELMAEKWEPFFTTKSTGMGMGLSISRSIIETHSGRLWAVNNPDQGATFHFTLPVMEGGFA